MIGTNNGEPGLTHQQQPSIITTAPPANYITPYVTTEEVDRKIAMALDDARGLKKDLFTSFGVFASLLVFASVEVKLLQQIQRLSLLVGMSLFFLAAMLLFNLALHGMFRPEKDIFKSQIFKLLLVFLALSFMCFVYAFLVPAGEGSNYFWRILGLWM